MFMSIISTWYLFIDKTKILSIVSLVEFIKHIRLKHLSYIFLRKEATNSCIYYLTFLSEFIFVINELIVLQSI